MDIVRIIKNNVIYTIVLMSIIILILNCNNISPLEIIQVDEIKPPQNVAVTPGDKKTLITWDTSAGAISYEIYWNKTSNVSENDNRINVTTNTYTHNGLINDTVYYYRILAINANNQRSMLSEEVSAAPGEIKIPSNVRIAWGAKKNGAKYKSIRYWNGTTTIDLSDDTYNNTDVQVSDNNVAWLRSTGYGNDVYLWNGSAIRNISALGPDSLRATALQLDGNFIVWLGMVDNSHQVFLWDGAAVKQISSGTKKCNDPRISGNKVVWYTTESQKNELYMYNGVSTEKINNDTNSLWPRISGDNVVWISRLNEDGVLCTEVFLYDGNSTKQLTNTQRSNIYPRIDGNRCTWESSSYIGGPLDLFYWNGTEVIQLTDNDKPDFCPELDGNNITWAGRDVTDLEIFYYNGQETRQITDNSYPDYSGKIASHYVIWHASVEQTNTEIFFFDGINTLQVTDNDYMDDIPDICIIE